MRVIIARVVVCDAGWRAFVGPATRTPRSVRGQCGPAPVHGDVRHAQALGERDLEPSACGGPPRWTARRNADGQLHRRAWLPIQRERLRTLWTPGTSRFAVKPRARPRPPGSAPRCGHNRRASPYTTATPAPAATQSVVQAARRRQPAIGHGDQHVAEGVPRVGSEQARCNRFACRCSHQVTPTLITRTASMTAGGTLVSGGSATAADRGRGQLEGQRGPAASPARTPRQAPNCGARRGGPGRGLVRQAHDQHPDHVVGQVTAGVQRASPSTLSAPGSRPTAVAAPPG